MPETTKTTIDNYVAHRLPPGGFVNAVLANNLSDAVGRADDGNRAALADIVSYCHWEIPGDCWGSTAAVDAWLAGGAR